MSRQKSGFRSRNECEKDEALCCHYGKIGIQAVAAAQTVLHHAPYDADVQVLNANKAFRESSRH